jgi:NAD(P)-dependent dehydrogenase (short-subunit alcohol dehydrogenase family)
MGETLQGKVAIVTGAASGIGAAIARLYAAEGCKVVVADMDAKGCDTVAAEVGGLASVVDVAVEDQVRAMVVSCDEVFGRLDILVNNAGVVPRWSRAEDTDLAVWDQVFAVNVRGVMACIKHALPLLERSRGAIINMSSGQYLRPDPNQPIYSASKFAVVGLSRSIAGQVGRHGVRVNAICPGAVTTEGLMARVGVRESEKADGREPFAAFDEDFTSKTALGLRLMAGHIADAALFLASDAASAITGEYLAVDAGRQG